MTIAGSNSPVVFLSMVGSPEGTSQVYYSSGSSGLNAQAPSQEIDLFYCIEEHGGKLYGCEFKWQGGEVRRVARKQFFEAYQESTVATVSQENFEEFLA
jgi:hypothetical protein